LTRQDTSRGRFYDIGERQLPSVTSILSVISKPALIAWSAKVEREMVIAEASSLHERLKEPLSAATFSLKLQNALSDEKAHKKLLRKAGEVGSQVHSLIEWGLRGQLLEKVGPSPEIGPQAQLAYAAFQRWKQTVKLKPIWVERTVWSEYYGYAGTADLLAEVNGEETLLDWKSGKAIYPEAYLQNAAYRQCVMEMEIGRPMRGMIIRLPKTSEDPEFEVQEVPQDSSELLKIFINAMALWKWQQQTAKFMD
jgi:hypothetical protein